LNPINIPNADACFEREKRGAGEEERDSLLGEIRNLVAPANDFIVLGRAITVPTSSLRLSMSGNLEEYFFDGRN